MRVQVNLATRPFVELRPFFLRLRLLMVALAVAGLAIALGAHFLSARAARQQAELDLLRNQTISTQQSRLHTEQRMRDPVNARVLDRAHFLNALFLRKSFSWTAVMMDLENVLPNGVQVTSIEPQVTADGGVMIRLRVAGERANAVQLVRNLERSRRFLEPRLTGEASQTKDTNARGGLAQPQGPNAPPAGVEFDILAHYNPLPVGEAYTEGHRRATAAAAAPESPVEMGPGPALSEPDVQRLLHGQRPSNAHHGFAPTGMLLLPYSGPVGKPYASTDPEALVTKGTP